MITFITQMIFIVNVHNERINEKLIQKGRAISKLDNAGNFQIFQFCQFLPENNSTIDDSDFEDNGESLHEIKPKNVYQITGKFAPIKDNIIDVVITSSKRLNLDADDISIGHPLVHLLGKVIHQTTISEHGYALTLQVKPYLSSTQCGAFDVILTHTTGGRFRNAFDKVKKYSSIFATGLLFFTNDLIYCEVLEFSFINTKTETDTNMIVPWKIENQNNNNNDANISKPKSIVQSRIAAIKASSEKENPSPSPSSSRTTTKKEIPLRKTKVSEIAKEMISNSLRDSNDDTDEITEENHEATINIDSEEDVDINEIITNISDDDEKVSKPKQSRKRSTRIATNNKKKKKV